LILDPLPNRAAFLLDALHNASLRKFLSFIILKKTNIWRIFIINSDNILFFQMGKKPLLFFGVIFCLASG